MRRRAYLDWLRGIAVLLMIEAHLIDSWTGGPDRETAAYRYAIVVGGMGTVSFLALAGAAVGLSAGSKLRRTGSVPAAANAVVRRGLAIFALAFLFRLQAWFLGWSHSARDLLKVDILNVMGPSIVCAALLWRASSSLRIRCVLFAAATLATVLLTPSIRAARLEALPDPLEAYIVPVPGLSNFVFLPWMGLVFAGAFAGVLIDAAARQESERRLNWWLAVGGALLVAVAFGASYLPPLDDNSDFWGTSASYFFIRAGLVLLGIGLAYFWDARFFRRGQWSPLVQLGRTSLFIYWIHVEMVYGLISLPLHHALTLGQALIAYVLFSALMLVCSIVKETIADRYQRRRERATAPV